MTEKERERVRQNVAAFGLLLFRCPTTGRVIEGMHGDDKALCRCGRSNPAVPAERTEQTGVHIVRFLQEATVDDYIAQREREWEAKR